MWSVDTLSDPIWQRLTWTLAHFLCQGLLIAVVLQADQWLLGTRRPQARYTLCLLAMLTMAACPPVTFALLGDDAPVVASEAAPRFSEPPQEVSSVTLPADLPPATITTQADTPSRADLPATRSRQPYEPRLADYVRSTQPYLLVGWLGGVCLLSLRLLLGMVGVQRLRFTRLAVPEALIASANRMGRRLALRRIPRVFASEKVREAVAVGLVRPIVLLPLSWLTEMPPEVLEAVLAHELAHIRRWDLWVNLFQRLMETFLFYHPAVWWLSRRIRQQREMCCDELAVAATGNRTTYATALETVARQRLTHIEPTLASAIGGSKTALLDRVRNILGMSSTNSRARWWPVGLISLFLLGTIWICSLATARPGPSGDAKAPDSTDAKIPEPTAWAAYLEDPYGSDAFSSLMKSMDYDPTEGIESWYIGGVFRAKRKDQEPLWVVEVTEGRLIEGDAPFVDARPAAYNGPCCLLVLGPKGKHLRTIEKESVYRNLVEPAGRRKSVYRQLQTKKIVDLPDLNGDSHAEIPARGFRDSISIYVTSDKSIPSVFAMTFPNRFLHSASGWGDFRLAYRADVPATLFVIATPYKKKDDVRATPVAGTNLLLPGEKVTVDNTRQPREFAQFKWVEEKDTFVGPSEGPGKTWRVLGTRREVALEPSAPIQPWDLLKIQVFGTLAELPIDGVFLVEPGGQLALGPAYGRVELEGLSHNAAEREIENRLRRVLADPRVQVIAAGWLARIRRAVLPKDPHHIRPNDSLSIHVVGTVLDHPIRGTYQVEPTGEVPLGPLYGRAAVSGLTFAGAAHAIEKRLREVLMDPEVAVTFAQWDTMEHDVRTLKAPYRIGPGDLLDVHAAGTIIDQPIQGTHLVEPSGQVLLGPFYGRVELKGLTLEEAEAAAKEHLSNFLAVPLVSITLGGWKDEGGVPKEASGNVLIKRQRTNIVYVMGSVAAPGAYELPRGASSLLDALTAAGGLSEEAGTFVEIRSIKDGKPQRVRLTLADLRDPAEGAHALRDGDTMIVERRKPKRQPSDLAHLRHTARLLSEQAMLVEHWEKLEDDKRYRPMIQELEKGLVKQTYESHFILPDARDEEQRPEDQFEKDVLKRFPAQKPGEMTGPQLPDYTERVLPETNQYQYYQPIYAESPVCVTCHSTLLKEPKPLKERDLMAVIRLTLPWPQTTEQ